MSGLEGVSYTERVFWRHGRKTGDIELPASMVELLDNNEAPSAQALRFTIEYRQTCTAGLAHAEQKMSSLDAENSEQWLTEKLELQKKIHTCNIILSPFRRVPPEILQEIFEHCMADYSKSRFALRLVCSMWKQLLLSMPQYWSHIQLDITPSSSINRTISQLETSAKDARHLSLSVSIYNHESDLSVSYGSDSEEDEETCCNAVVTRFLSNLSLVERTSRFSLVSKSPVFSSTLLEAAGYPSGPGLTQLQTLAFSHRSWTRDFDIDFREDYLRTYDGGDDWIGILLAGAASLRKVSFGQQALKSARLSGADFPWAQLTHVFMEPVLSVYGWWDVLRKCPNLTTGYFFVTESYCEYDGRDFKALTLPKVEEMTVAFVDYYGVTCLEAIQMTATFPNLKRFSLHVNEVWETIFEPLSLAEEMPRMEVLSIPQSWTLGNHHRNGFLRMFPNIKELELGVLQSDLLETLQFLTAPDPSSSADGILPHLQSITIEVGTESAQGLQPEETQGFVTMVKSRRSDGEHPHSDHLDRLKSARLYFLKHNSRSRSSSPSPSTSSPLTKSPAQEDVWLSPDTVAEIFRAIREQLKSLTDSGLELQVARADHSFGSYAYKWEEACKC